MSHALESLSKKLTWQLHDLNGLIQDIKQRIKRVESEFLACDEKIKQVNQIPEHILPEQEMARLQFILHQQQQQDNLSTQKIDLTAQYDVLQAKQLRLKVELKRIETYQQQQNESRRQQAQIAQYKQDDEWSLLHREQV